MVVCTDDQVVTEQTLPNSSISGLNKSLKSGLCFGWAQLCYYNLFYLKYSIIFTANQPSIKCVWGLTLL